MTVGSSVSPEGTGREGEGRGIGWLWELGKSSRLAFLGQKFSPYVHEGGIEFVEEKNRIFLRHVRREDEGQNSVGNTPFDRMDANDLSSDHR